MTLFLIILLVVFLATSATLSASETSLFSLSSMKLREFREGRNPKGRVVVHLLRDPRKLLVTIMIVNILINVLIQNVVSSIFGTFSGWLLNVGVPLVLTVIFGEVLPKSVAISNNTKIALRLAKPLYYIEILVTPIRKILMPITALLSRVMFFFLRYRSSVSHEELKAVLKASKEFGNLDVEEAKLLRGFLNLEDDIAKEMMRPRQEVLYYNVEAPLEELHELFVEKECTRVPVCHGDLEEIVGIISAEQYFIHSDRIKCGRDLEKYCVKPFYVPEATTGRKLLTQFYDNRRSMAMVVDEYGAIAGLITNEDLEESVIGEIVDRRDEEKHFVRVGKDVIIASGKMELAEFEEAFDYHLESPNNMATVSGWLTEMMGDIPKEGAKYETEDFLFHVLGAEKTRVTRIYIRRVS